MVTAAPLVGVIMGSDSDLPTMKEAIAVLEVFQISHEVASLTPLPVIGVPVVTRTLQGLDSLYSIVQMPAGIPVATVAIGNAKNAGLLAVQILAIGNADLLEQVIAYRQSLSDSVLEKQSNLQRLGYQDYLGQSSPK